ncbi:hypothetical protein TNCV_1069621 [Trichonephila clavipes]|nr:hypothetical protein TNCV_1069621 [Trichonephila clavipes]
MITLVRRLLLIYIDTTTTHSPVSELANRRTYDTIVKPSVRVVTVTSSESDNFDVSGESDNFVASGQEWRTSGTRAIDGTRHDIFATSAIKIGYILFQNFKVAYEVLRTNASDRSRDDGECTRLLLSYIGYVLDYNCLGYKVCLRIA